MIENEEEGIFLPQNKEYSNTSEMVKMIAAMPWEKSSIDKRDGMAFEDYESFYRACQ